MKRIFIVVILLFAGFINSSRADEGMWIPLLIEKFNIEDMQAKGFKLSAEDIYSINQACLMDAIVIFGRGCTGELVSDQGLLLTNFHCGRGSIQKLSSIKNDYLKDGFWAMNKEQELPNPDLSVKFLERIEDVTEKVLENVTEDITEEERENAIKLKIEKIEAEAVGKTHLIAKVKPFYYGNQYFLFVYQEYKDVRLVGTPPSAIGNFGGDTDNWMWPRHTGDFSIFRIYADKDNKPASYSPDNVPYKPKKFLTISTKGVKEGDFTWVMGYPGSTYKYLISDAIRLIAEVRNPNKIKLRDFRFDIIKAHELNNDTVRLKYTSKKNRISNSWKRWKGEIKGLERLNAIDKKVELEEKFTEWAADKIEYKNILSELSDIYKNIEEYAVAYDYYKEAIMAIEIVDFASEFEQLIKMSEMDNDSDSWNCEMEELIKNIDSFFKDYVQSIDEEIFNELLPMYFSNVDQKFYPDLNYEKDIKDYKTFIESLYKSTVFNKQKKILELLDSESKNEIGDLANDPVYKFYTAFNEVYKIEVFPAYDSLSQSAENLYRKYMKGLMEMQKEKILFPDANSTMRVSYGEVMGSFPRDGVEYLYQTTLDGVIEKDNPNIYDYDVPDKLKKLYASKDYGMYEVDGTVPVCFIATNHTTGGNSGSPVLDSEGYLIGLNFDRVWEGIMSDMVFDPEQSRNITLDIRYVLFIIDKFAGAQHLINEMTIIK